LPLSGINKELGKEVKEGAELAFSEANRKGEIGGKKIDLIVYDDKYEPAKTLANTRRLIDRDDVCALFGFVGTPTSRAVLPYIDVVPFIAPYTGASFLRDPEWKNIVNFRNSYAREMETIVHYLHDEKGYQRFAIFYQNDSYGIDGFNALTQVLKKRNIELVGEGTYKRNTLSIRHGLEDLRRSAPEVVVIVGAYKPSARFIRAWRKGVSGDTLFATISFVNADALIRELGPDLSQGILFSSTVPSYDDPSLPAAREYRRLLGSTDPNTRGSFASFESFLAAKTVIRALERLGDESKAERLIHSLKGLSGESIGGIPLNYKNGALLDRTYLFRYQEGRFVSVPRTLR